MKIRDWSGVRVGKLTAKVISGSNNGAIWECICDCGNTVHASSARLSTAVSRGDNASCGCAKYDNGRELRDAARNGEKYYFTGIKCKRGHIANRFVNGRKCTECAKEDDLKSRNSRLEYFKNYQKNNPEKTKAAQHKFRMKNRDKIREYHKARRDIPDVKKKRADYQRARYHRARSKGRITRGDILKKGELQNWCCAECKKRIDEYHVDHIVPVSSGGDNAFHNIQILCPKCNLKKGAKDPIDWAKENGRLF